MGNDASYEEEMNIKKLSPEDVKKHEGQWVFVFNKEPGVVACSAENVHELMTKVGELGEKDLGAGFGFEVLTEKV